MICESTLVLSFVSLLLYGAVLYVIAIFKKDNSIADVGWGLGFVLVGWASVSWPLTLPSGLLLSAVTIWGGRLFYRILRRKYIRPGEDERYKKWRETWRYFYLRSYIQIFFLQPLLLFLNATPLILYFSLNPSVALFDWPMALGVALWSAGLITEVVADYQLDTFYRQRRSGELFCQRGLWKYSRHPNYFGEILLWWGIYFYVATSIGWWTALIGPMTISILLLFVSGIPLAEERLKHHPEYQRYQSTTSVLIPWFHIKEK